MFKNYPWKNSIYKWSKKKYLSNFKKKSKEKAKNKKVK